MCCRNDLGHLKTATLKVTTESLELEYGWGYEETNLQAPELSPSLPVSQLSSAMSKKKKKPHSHPRNKGKGRIKGKIGSVPHSFLQEVKNSGGGCFKGWSETLSRNVVLRGDGMWGPGARKAPPPGRQPGSKGPWEGKCTHNVERRRNVSKRTSYSSLQVLPGAGLRKLLV